MFVGLETTSEGLREEPNKGREKDKTVSELRQERHGRKEICRSSRSSTRGFVIAHYQYATLIAAKTSTKRQCYKHLAPTREIASSLLSIYGSPVSKRSQGSPSRRDESILRHTIARYLNERSSDRFARFTLDDQLDHPIVPQSRRIHSLGTYLDDL